MNEQIPAATLDQLISATRTALATRLAGEPGASSLQPGIDLALNALRLCGKELGEPVTCIGGTLDEYVERIAANLQTRARGGWPPMSPI